VYKGLFLGALAAAVLAGPSLAAPAQPQAFAWIVTPDEDSCHTDVELIGRSGEPAIVSLVSDGQRVLLKFTKDELPKRAFLAIDIDKKPYSNLLMRQEDPKVGTMTLSDETIAALRRGGTLLIAWLADEPMSAKLVGSEQGIADLRICGAQVNGQYHAQLAAKQESEARAAADARAKQLADEQLALVRAQKEAAEAQAQKLTEDARREQAELDARKERAAADERQRAYEDQQRAYQEQRQEYLRRYYPRASYPPAYYQPYPNDQD
jgi:hypothetical protein